MSTIQNTAKIVPPQTMIKPILGLPAFSLFTPMSLLGMNHMMMRPIQQNLFTHNRLLGIGMNNQLGQGGFQQLNLLNLPNQLNKQSDESLNKNKQ